MKISAGKHKIIGGFTTLGGKKTKIGIKAVKSERPKRHVTTEDIINTFKKLQENPIFLQPEEMVSAKWKNFQ